MSEFKLPRKTYLYFVAQSINLTAAVMSVTMAGIVGSSMAPSPVWSTLPYGVQFLFVMIATYPASRLMQGFGRRAGFHVGNGALALSGALGFLALQLDRFDLLVCAHGALGVYIACANFNRFAATDGLTNELKPKAISLVVAGGVLAAFIGPAAASALRSVADYNDFALCYGFFIVLSITATIVNSLIPAQLPPRGEAPRSPSLEITSILRRTDVMVPIAVAAGGYGLMNLLMIQASLQMQADHVHFTEVGAAIQWHVFAMFAPSFFTGYLIARIGIRRVMSAGVVLILICSCMNLYSTERTSIVIALIFLGLGWNFTYVGAGAMLARSLSENPAAIRIQGVNDLAIAVAATVGAFMPAVLFSQIGWAGTNAVSAALCLSLIALLVLARQPAQPGSNARCENG